MLEGRFLLSSYVIKKVLVSLAKNTYFFIATFQVLFIPKKQAIFFFGLSRGVAGFCWMKFVSTINQPFL
jgi:hypothetical protein